MASSAGRASCRSCKTPVVAIRAEPDEQAEQVTQALAGERLVVEELRAGWARVRTAYDYPGWIRQAELGEVEGEWPPPVRDGDPVEEARAYLGAPYEWGGMSERGIDCSGLVHMSYRRLGRLVPRDADQQEGAGEEVAEVQPGDLVTYGERSTTHIAFWLGEGRILHAAGGRGVVEEAEPAELTRIRRRGVRL